MTREEILAKSTPRPWQKGIYRARYERDGLVKSEHLAVWDASVRVGESGHPVCLVAPGNRIDERDEVNADLIVLAVNACEPREALLRQIVGTLERARAAITAEFRPCDNFAGHNPEVVIGDIDAALAAARKEMP